MSEQKKNKALFESDKLYSKTIFDMKRAINQEDKFISDLKVKIKK